MRYWKRTLYEHVHAFFLSFKFDFIEIVILLQNFDTGGLNYLKNINENIDVKIKHFFCYDFCAFSNALENTHIFE